MSCRNPQKSAVHFSAREVVEALSTLESASNYLFAQHSDTMPRAEAKAHFEARTILLRARVALLEEIVFDGESGDG